MDVSVRVFYWRRQQVVLKRFELDAMTYENISYFRKEAGIAKRLSHENVVNFLRIVVDPPAIGIMMEFCGNGDLRNLLDRGNLDKRNMEEGWEPLRCALEISSGMRYLHQMNCVHLDLKSPSILLDADWRAKITDFGDAAVTHTIEMEDARFMKGTPQWVAPGLLGASPGGSEFKSMDVHSFRVKLWELLTFQVPCKFVSRYSACFANAGKQIPARGHRLTESSKAWSPCFNATTLLLGRTSLFLLGS